MSHIVSIKTQLRDPAAIAAACQRLRLSAPIHGTAQLYSGEVTGLLVQLPEWKYPIAIDTQTGEVHHDNFEGAWGDQPHLDRFLQNYAVEVVRIEARRRGRTVTESAMEDGSIRLQIQEGT